MVRGGFGTRMKPEGVWADLLRRRFRVAMARLGMTGPSVALDCSHFRRPSRDGQLSLL